MFKLWLFWAFLRIQLLGLLRTMTTFTSGQASRPDSSTGIATRSAEELPGYLPWEWWLCSSSSNPEPSHHRNVRCISRVLCRCSDTRERGRDGLSPARRSSLQGDSVFLQLYVLLWSKRYGATLHALPLAFAWACLFSEVLIENKKKRSSERTEETSSEAAAQSSSACLGVWVFCCCCLLLDLGEEL